MGFFRWFSRPLPRYVCPLCLGTEDAPGPCSFCDSELCAGSEREPLDVYLAARSLAELEQQLVVAQQRERAAQGGKRFYARDYRRGVEALLRYKRRLGHAP